MAATAEAANGALPWNWGRLPDSAKAALLLGERRVEGLAENRWLHTKIVEEAAHYMRQAERTRTKRVVGHYGRVRGTSDGERGGE